jgi:phospho-2-dehydro-3-deoxyheptonate aldolase
VLTTFRLSSILKDFKGNPDVHVILRGGAKGPNYAAEYVRDAGEKLLKAGLPPKIMVCLHLSILSQLAHMYALRRLTAVMATAASSTNDKLTLRKT